MLQTEQSVPDIVFEDQGQIVILPDELDEHISF